MKNVQKTSNSVRYTPSSEPFRIYMRVMLPKMAPTSGRNAYTSLLIWEWPTSWLPVVGLADLRGGTTLPTEIYIR
jgi:hypothetical protein